MINFEPSPPIGSTKSPYRLLRTPSKGTLHIWITSDTLLGCWTHYYGGRTVPCSGDACDACSAGSSMRWHGYLSAIDAKDSEPILFELTASAAEQALAYRAKHGTLRGCDCLASRVSPRPNARVRLRMKPLDLSNTDLPKPLTIIPALCHIWGVPATDAQVSPSRGTTNLDGIRAPQPPPDRATPNANGNGLAHIKEVLGQ